MADLWESSFVPRVLVEVLTLKMCYRRRKVRWFLGYNNLVLEEGMRRKIIGKGEIILRAKKLRLMDNKELGD